MVLKRRTGTLWVNAQIKERGEVSTQREASAMLVRQNIPPSGEPSFGYEEALARRAKLLARFVLAALAFFFVAVWSWILGIILHTL
jgi:hypothetical protein